MLTTQPRRGIAMLLVILALMMATILTTAYLASRDNSPVIGENVAAAAAARWAAISGVQVGAAVMETEEDWQDAGGVLLDHVDLAGADVSVQVLDMATGEAPTDKTRYLEMTSTAIVDGISQVATATAEIQRQDKLVDVDLSEFVAYAGNTIKMDSSATMMTWPNSPMAKAGDPLNIGTNSVAAQSIYVRDLAGAANSQAYVKPGASGTLIDVQSGPAIRSKPLPDPLPLPAPPDAGVALPNRLLKPPDMTWAAATTTVSADARYFRIQIQNNSTVILNGTTTLVADEDFLMNPGSKLVVNGDNKVVVFDDLKLDQASIEVAPTARLQLFIRHDMTLSDGYIGDTRVDNSRPVDGSAPYVASLERIQLWGITPVSTLKGWYLTKQSVAIGNLYNPYLIAQIREDSAVYGRIVAKDIYLTQNGAIFYDPLLNQDRGFTNFDSAIYDSGGRMRATFSSLTNLSSGTLSVVSTTTGTVVSAADRLLGTVAAPAPEVVAPTEPTPRNIPVNVSITSLGVNPLDWEN